jgi:hypothetical protein
MSPVINISPRCTKQMHPWTPNLWNECMRLTPSPFFPLLTPPARGSSSTKMATVRFLRFLLSSRKKRHQWCAQPLLPYLHQSAPLSLPKQRLPLYSRSGQQLGFWPADRVSPGGQYHQARAPCPVAPPSPTPAWQHRGAEVADKEDAAHIARIGDHQGARPGRPLARKKTSKP